MSNNSSPGAAQMFSAGCRFFLMVFALCISLSPCQAQSPAPLAVYSLRRFSASYSGPAVDVRRASDNTTTTIGFTPSGALDTTTLGAFAGSSDVYVTRWYDQSGAGVHLSQSDTSLQPLIVNAGTIPTDSYGLPRIQFTDSSLEGSGLSINNQNLTAFFVQQAPRDRAYKRLLIVGPRLDHRPHLQYTVRDWGAALSLAEGSEDASARDNFEVNVGVQSWMRTIQILDCNGQTVRFFRNRTLRDTWTHELNESAPDRFQIGSYRGHLSEIALYPALSDAERLVVYNAINGHFHTGPTTINEGALLPQDWQWEVGLYDWLETITQGQVTTTPRNLEWDGSYANIAQLEELWLGLYGGTSEYIEHDMEIVRSAPKWWVLNDGQGSGIEATGSVRVFRFASEAAVWYTQNLSLTGGGQGNPFYHDPAVCRRALISSAVDMMLYDQLQAESSYWLSAMNVGGPLNGWVWAYRVCKDLLDSGTQNAFQDGFRAMADKILEGGAHDVNGNIDAHAIAALGHVYKILPDAAGKDLALRAAKKVLFGSETGTPQTTDYASGIYRRAGYIDEGDSPETTYNGASLFHIMQTQAVTRDEPVWDFMDTIVRDMLSFKLYQYFPDPDGFWDGPSGYAGRTGGSYVRDQRSKLWRDITAAATFVEGRPLIRTFKFGGGSRIGSESQLAEAILRAVSTFNNRDIGVPSSTEAPGFRVTRFPSENLYFPESGWHPTLKALGDSSHQTTLVPYEHDQGFSKSFDNEFWAYKAHDGTQKFGFFVETLEDPGHYAGWYGGSLQTFWTEKSGMVILARHDKSGDGDGEGPPYPTPYENTRIWQEGVWTDSERNRTYLYGVSTWATHHIWGRDENGRAFSTAATDDLMHQGSFATQGTNPSVEIKTTLSAESRAGQETEGVLEGTTTFVNRFQAAGRGLRITHTITSDGHDQITELWATLPVFLRDNSPESGQGNLTDTTIDYWNGSSWSTLGTALQATKKLRLGRDFGNGPQYTYIAFHQTRRVKLSASVWQQSYGGYSRIRNVHIDLHGNPGSSIQFPASMSLRLTIQTTDDPAPASPQNLRRAR